MRILLALVLLYSMQTQAWTLYTKPGVEYAQFNAMLEDPECSKWLRKTAVHPHSDEAVLQIVTSVNKVLHDTFVYRSDGISDHWCQRLAEAQEAIRSGGTWTGDCDDFLFTFYAALRLWGVDPERIMAHIVLTKMQALLNQGYHPLHPKVKHDNHTILSIDAGKRVVVDNRSEKIKNLFDIMGAGKDYMPYAVNKPHHLSKTWAREWHGNNKGE